MSMIKRLKELDKHATPRPWVLNYEGEMYPNLFLDLDREIGLTPVQDLHLIEYVRNSLPIIIECLEDAEELRESVLKNEYIHQHKLAISHEKRWRLNEET